MVNIYLDETGEKSKLKVKKFYCQKLLNIYVFSIEIIL